MVGSSFTDLTCACFATLIYGLSLVLTGFFFFNLPNDILNDQSRQGEAEYSGDLNHGTVGLRFAEAALLVGDSGVRLPVSPLLFTIDAENGLP